MALAISVLIAACYDQGSLGPVGATGPVGPQGPIGPSDPALVAKDSTGATLGLYVVSTGQGPGEFLLFQVNGAWYQTRFDNQGVLVRSTNDLNSGYFTTTDCSGDRYVDAQNNRVPLIPLVTIVGTRAYFAEPYGAAVNVQSVFDVSGCHTYGVFNYVVSIIKSIDVSFLTSAVGPYFVSLN